MPWWAEYVAGTDPENPASVFAINGLLATRDGDNIVTWPSVAGRVYGLDFTTNLLQGFAPVPGAAALPATPPVNVYTNTATMHAPQLFYRAHVRLP